MSNATNRPNILWISFEDTNPFYGCYGDPTAKTPNLDKLAKEGITFSNCYSTAGVCAPARSAIITGMYPTSIGTHHMRTTHVNENCPDLPTPYSAVVPHYVKAFPEYLRAAGYFCTNNEKTDYQFDPPSTAWDELSDQAHWRNRPDHDQPFFAVFNPTRTHESGMWEDKTPEVDIDPTDVRVPPYFPDTPKVREAIARMHGNIARSDQQLGELLAQLEEDGLSENTIVMHWSDHGPMPRGKRWPYDSGIRVPLIIKWPAGAGNPGATVGESQAYEKTQNALTKGGFGPDMIEATVNAAGGHLANNRAIKESTKSGVPVAKPRAPISGFAPDAITDRLVSTIDLGPTVLSLAGLPIPPYMQGRAFMGHAAKEERRYIFATRDRYDTSYDMIRAARDRRYKYLANYCLNQERLVWVLYRNRHPIMQELYKGYLENSLNAEQLALFEARTAEELYDTWSDPYELHNLADDPSHRETLARLRNTVREWQREVGDMGYESESEMVRRWYPDGKQPTTAAPIFAPISAKSYAREITTQAELNAPAKLQIQCSTQGASIEYRLSNDSAGRWKLYSSPIDLPVGEYEVTARAARIGYKPSDEATITIRVDKA
ncbi:MAG: sulfatase [Spirochaetota bacterium]